MAELQFEDTPRAITNPVLIVAGSHRRTDEFDQLRIDRVVGKALAQVDRIFFGRQGRKDALPRITRSEKSVACAQKINKNM